MKIGIYPLPNPLPSSKALTENREQESISGSSSNTEGVRDSKDALAPFLLDEEKKSQIKKGIASLLEGVSFYEAERLIFQFLTELKGKAVIAS